MLTGHLTRFIAVTVTVLGLATTASAQTVGQVSLVKFWGYAQPPGAAGWSDAYARDPVVFEQSLRTPGDAALHIAFEDQSVLRMGALSEVRVDRFVYDPDTSAGDMLVSLSKGLFRFVSGKMRKQGVQLRTPVAAIGIRGTDFYVEVLDDGTTLVEVVSGEVTVTPLGGGGGVSITANQTASVAPNAQAATTGSRTVARDTGLSADGGTQGGFGGAGNDSGGGGTGGHD